MFLGFVLFYNYPVIVFFVRMRTFKVPHPMFGLWGVLVSLFRLICSLLQDEEAAFFLRRVCWMSEVRIRKHDKNLFGLHELQLKECLLLVYSVFEATLVLKPGCAIELLIGSKRIIVV